MSISMRHGKAEFEAAIVSGDPDRVNARIKEVKRAPVAERAHLFVSCVEEFSELYYVDDGYQRLSVVRFLRDLHVPQVPVAYRDAFWELLLDAIVDDDGRVRKAAVKAIDKVVTLASYHERPIDPLRGDLEDLATSENQENQELDEALRTAERYTGGWL